MPVGDYVPSYLSIEYGRLQIFLSDNYHADGKPRDFGQNRIYGIKIGKDKPFVLDFSNKPEVLFASPAKDKTVQAGRRSQGQGGPDRSGARHHDPPPRRHVAEEEGNGQIRRRARNTLTKGRSRSIRSSRSPTRPAKKSPRA